MGYCLCVFDSDFDDDHEAEELAECDIGDFCDLAFFRSSIDCHLGAGRYPTLTRLLDSGARFPASEVRELEREVREIGTACREFPSERMKIAFQRVAEGAIEPAAASFVLCAQERFDDPLACIMTFTWSPNEIAPFQRQLQEIAAAFGELPSEGTLEDLSSASEDGGESRVEALRLFPRR